MRAGAKAPVLCRDTLQQAGACIWVLEVGDKNGVEMLVH